MMQNRKTGNGLLPGISVGAMLIGVFLISRSVA